MLAHSLTWTITHPRTNFLFIVQKENYVTDDVWIKHTVGIVQEG